MKIFLNIFLIVVIYFLFNQITFAKTLTCEKAEKNGKPLVVLYSADYCIYCNKFKPIFYDLANNLSGKYTFVYYDITKKYKKSICNNIELTSLPTLYIIDLKTRKKYVIPENFYSKPINLEHILNKYYKIIK